MLFVVLHALVDDFEVLIKILVSGSRCSHPEIFFVVIFEYLALELVGREIRHVAQVPQVMWGVLRRLIEGEGSCVEVDTLVVVFGAGQLEPLARDHLPVKVGIGGV